MRGNGLRPALGQTRTQDHYGLSSLAAGLHCGSKGISVGQAFQVKSDAVGMRITRQPVQDFYR